ncbi:MAG: polysaccharide biosynthesis protein, partial [Dehalobacterium sp.]
GGEIFILDMGEPVKIMDLARSLIELSGFTPGKDIEIKVTGTRPGEKLYEELLTAEEGVSATTHKRIFVAKRGTIMPDLIEERIIARIVNGTLPQNEQDAFLMIQEFLPDFRNAMDSGRKQVWTMSEKGQEQKMVADL